MSSNINLQGITKHSMRRLTRADSCGWGFETKCGFLHFCGSSGFFFSIPFYQTNRDVWKEQAIAASPTVPVSTTTNAETGRLLSWTATARNGPAAATGFKQQQQRVSWRGRRHAILPGRSGRLRRLWAASASGIHGRTCADPAITWAQLPEERISRVADALHQHVAVLCDSDIPVSVWMAR